MSSGITVRDPNASKGIEKDLCKMITLLQKVLDLLDAEPSPHILNEQTLYLIDIILKCCKNYRYGN